MILPGSRCRVNSHAEVLRLVSVAQGVATVRSVESGRTWQESYYHLTCELSKNPRGTKHRGTHYDELRAAQAAEREKDGEGVHEND